MRQGSAWLRLRNSLGLLLCGLCKVKHANEAADDLNFLHVRLLVLPVDANVFNEILRHSGIQRLQTGALLCRSRKIPRVGILL